MAQKKIDPQIGLTAKQVAARMQNGQHNQPMKPLTRSVSAIIRQNTLTLFNFVNLALGALIVTTGSYKNLLFLFVAIINTAIGSFQEIRAKRQIDSMSILAASKVQTRRDGKVTAIDSEQIVLDDILLLKRGNQIPVDGTVVSTSGLEVDESPLTGESNPVVKPVGARLLSGSFIVAGKAAMQVSAVGQDTFASKLALEAKTEKVTHSQLLDTINRIIKVLTYVLIPLGAILFAVSMIRRGDYNQAVISTSAAMIGMIPEGLVLLTNVALAVSARNLAQKRVLVRALPAIEALARVDVICLDKTGTITSGKLQVKDVKPIAGFSKKQLLEAAAKVTYALNDDNETALAIKDAAADPNAVPTQTMPFSSARKWSGAAFNQEGLVMGAPEFIFDQPLSGSAQTFLQEQTKAGLRVIAVASCQVPLSAKLTDPHLLGFILISDQLRPSAQATLEFFASQDVDLKVISGDNPVTAANVARLAGLTGAEHYVDMSSIAKDTDFQQLVQENTVFGRVTPVQKRALIAALQQNHHTVAMTGDGVNDVLALRQSDCAIAMASGAEAAKSIADFVLLDSNFDALSGVLNEGRRVINNIERVASLYLVKTIFSVILTAIFVFLPLDYPIQPINLTPVSAITVAIPSFFLTLEPNFNRVSGQFMKKVMTVAMPAALMVVGYTLVLTWFEYFFGWSFGLTSTLVTLMIGVIQLHVLTLVARPFNRYKTLLGILLVGALFVTFFIIGRVFSLANLWRIDLFIIYAIMIGACTPIYYFLQEFLGRRVLSRINWR